MAVLKNKTQNNFTMISNYVLRDRELSMKDRGVFCTICSLPDGWDFSIAGLSAIVPDGIDAIRASVINLEKLGYMERTKSRGKNGKYISEIEVFAEKRTMLDLPSRKNQHGKTVTVNPREYNMDNKKQNIKKDNKKTIYQSENVPEIERQTDVVTYKKIIADHIKLSWLYEIAKQHGDKEVAMVTEIYELICDMVCYPRENVLIKGVSYPWQTVKSRFLKIRYEHVADILNRIVDAELGIKNMYSYLVSTLYISSMVGTLEAQAGLHDDYLKYLRGKPYS